MNHLTDCQIYSLKERLISEIDNFMLLDNKNIFSNINYQNLKIRNREKYDETINNSPTSNEFFIENHYLDNISAINNALKKISNNTYGTCKVCGDCIDFNRLRAYPTASHCSACKLADEKVDQIHI